MEGETPNRAERRRQEKEQSKKGEEDYGQVFPRTFKECPVCGCPARFTLEALKGIMSEEELKAKPPALGSMEYIFQTPLYNIRVVVVYDSCVRCGALYTIARDVKKNLRLGPTVPGPRRPLVSGG